MYWYYGPCSPPAQSVSCLTSVSYINHLLLYNNITTNLASENNTHLSHNLCAQESVNTSQLSPVLQGSQGCSQGVGQGWGPLRLKWGRIHHQAHLVVGSIKFSRLLDQGSLVWSFLSRGLAHCSCLLLLSQQRKEHLHARKALWSHVMSSHLWNSLHVLAISV